MAKAIQQTTDLLKLIDDCFPFPKYRENQKEVIEEILEAFQKYKYVILEAPTGSGKSAIAMTLAKMYKKIKAKTHILTIQKLLQDQYARDFERQLFVMKGKGNFRCVMNNAICTLGECEVQNDKKLKADCLSENICPYIANARMAQKSGVVVHNFDSFYYQKNVFFGKRPLMIIDEAHNLEQKFMNFVSFTIDNKEFVDVRIPVPDDHTDVDSYDVFLEEYKQILLKEYAEINERKRLSSELINYRDNIERLSQKISFFQYVKTQGIKFVFEYSQDKEYQKIKFKPIFVWSFTSQILDYADNILMMSATILDAEGFARNVGIKEGDYYSIEMPSLFPIENRPFYITDEVNLTWKTYNEEIKKLPKIINRYLTNYEGEKGIIHTHTNRLVDYIRQYCNSSRMIFKNDFKNVGDLLKAHDKKKDSVIVASGFHEGLDLKDDMSRFQVLLKVPYPSLGDKQIKARMDIDTSYYGWMTALKLVQSYGRSVRNEDDWCDTYCIDKNFRRFYGMNKKLLPRWFKEAVVWD